MLTIDARGSRGFIALVVQNKDIDINSTNEIFIVILIANVHGRKVIAQVPSMFSTSKGTLISQPRNIYWTYVGPSDDLESLCHLVTYLGRHQKTSKVILMGSN
jgi:hypothetical protein